jgi:TrmH family RNA methyltransferase
MNIDYLAFTEAARAQYEKLLIDGQIRNIPAHSVSSKLATRISDTETPQGIFAVVNIKADEAKPEGDLILALDAVQDPGNVGTLIRTAAWFGIRTILFGEGSADPYSPKVVRSSQGALFSVACLTKTDLTTALGDLKKQGYIVHAAMLDPAARSLYSVAPAKRSVVLLGNEAHGVSPQIERMADVKLLIPRYGEGESLNVAVSGAIVLAEFRRASSVRTLPVSI